MKNTINITYTVILATISVVIFIFNWAPMLHYYNEWSNYWDTKEMSTYEITIDESDRPKSVNYPDLYNDCAKMIDNILGKSTSRYYTISGVDEDGVCYISIYVKIIK